MQALRPRGLWHDNDAMTISREEIEHLAGLAGLRLGEDEAGRLEQDLARILDYLRILEAADEVPATVDSPGRLRADEPRPGSTRAQALRDAPEMMDGCFVVPPVVEGTEHEPARDD